MNGIERAFHDRSRKLFVPFVTAGDPDDETSLEIILKLVECGADIIELGVPFSDPMADGPTIQRSSQRALKNGTNIGRILKIVETLRKASHVPIVLFSYLNPILKFGIENLAAEAKRLSIDGLLLTDVIDDEAEDIAAAMRTADVDLISLIAPTSTDERIEQISKRSRGFIYAVARAGVTGVQSETSSDARKLVERIRRHTDLPVAVGFGISTKQQIEEVWQYADAAVVGSAIVSEIEKAISPEEAVVNTETFVRSLLTQVANNRIRK